MCYKVTRAYLYKLDLEQLLKVGSREVTRAYLYKLDLEQLLKVFIRNKIKNTFQKRIDKSIKLRQNLYP